MNKIKLIMTSVLFLFTLTGLAQPPSSPAQQKETTLTLQLKNNTDFDLGVTPQVKQGKLLQYPDPLLKKGQEGKIVLQTVNQQLSGGFFFQAAKGGQYEMILNFDKNKFSVGIPSPVGLLYEQNSLTWDENNNSINITGTIIAIPSQNPVRNIG